MTGTIDISLCSSARLRCQPYQVGLPRASCTQHLASKIWLMWVNQQLIELLGGVLYIDFQSQT